jgi:hypothetical protein
LIFTYTPIMHGIIRHNHNDRTVTITGYANWFPGLIVILMLVQFGSRATDIVNVLLIGFIILYGIEFYLFNRVYESIKKEYQVRDITVKEE